MGKTDCLYTSNCDSIKETKSLGLSAVNNTGSVDPPGINNYLNYFITSRTGNQSAKAFKYHVAWQGPIHEKSH
jgi:hypothetical protein